jgi:hypothetical protein
MKENALQQLHTDFISCLVDVGAVVETHLTKSHDGNYSTRDGYHTHRSGRDGRKGGCVCAFVSGHFDSDLFTKSNTEEGFQKHPEISWVKMQKTLCICLVCAIYHPPKPVYNSNEFLARLQ